MPGDPPEANREIRTEERRESHFSERFPSPSTRFWLTASAVILVAACAATGIWGFYRFRIPPMPAVFRQTLPIPVPINGKIALRMPNGTLVGRVGAYPNELTTYLWLEYLRSLKLLKGSETLMRSVEDNNRPTFMLYVVLPNDLLSGSTLLSQLQIDRYIHSFTLESPPRSEIDDWEKETRLFEATYARPVRAKLMHLPPSQLHSAVARFILFKVRTDNRVRKQLLPIPKVLTPAESQEFAADMIAVAKFYDLPLTMLLGIGAMENNYLSVRGDLERAVWKKRAQPGDIVLRRRDGRVLVRNYSVGPWQMTRETLRYAHALCMRDRHNRNYDALPARLRPPRKLNLDQVDSHVLTTYAGMLLRTLLDYFHGNVQEAEGAYNGGAGDPNLKYAKGVSMVATYAHRVLSAAARRERVAVRETPLRVVSAINNR